jgi:hypothetical protein
MTMRIPVKDSAQGASFLVRVAPRASRTAIVGVFGEGENAALKMALRAPAVEGRANVALIEFLAELFGSPRSAIAIAGGEHARNKRIVVHGRSAADVQVTIKTALAESAK